MHHWIKTGLCATALLLTTTTALANGVLYLYGTTLSNGTVTYTPPDSTATPSVNFPGNKEAPIRVTFDMFQSVTVNLPIDDVVGRKLTAKTMYFSNDTGATSNSFALHAVTMGTETDPHQSCAGFSGTLEEAQILGGAEIAAEPGVTVICLTRL